MEGLAHVNNIDNESTGAITNVFSHFKNINDESPDYTLAKMTTYASEFQRHAKEKLSEAEGQLSVLEECHAAAKMAVDKQMQRALAFINTWKQDFMKELEEEYSKKRSKVTAFKQNLSNNNEMLLKAIFKAQVCLASKREAVTEDQCYDYLTGLMEPAEHIIQTHIENVDPPVFVPNEEFEEYCWQIEMRHSLGYVQSSPYFPKNFQLEEISGIHGTFKVMNWTKPVDDNVKTLLVWEVESWCSGNRGKVVKTVTGVDAIALPDMNVAPGLYLIAAKVFHQHVKCSPKAISYASIKDREVQHCSQVVIEGFSPKISTPEIEVLDTQHRSKTPVCGSRDNKRTHPPSLQDIIVEDEEVLMILSDDYSSSSTVEFIEEKHEKPVNESSSDMERGLRKVEGTNKLPRNVGKPLGKLVSRKTQLSELTSLRKPRKMSSEDVGMKAQKLGVSCKVQDNEEPIPIKENGKDLKPTFVFPSTASTTSTSLTSTGGAGKAAQNSMEGSRSATFISKPL